MKVVISHPTGNESFRGAALGLQKAGMLTSLQTTVTTFPGNIFDKLSAFGPFAELSRRRYDPVLVQYTTSWPWYELARFAATKAGFKSLVKHESGIFSIDAVYQNIDKRVAKSLKKLAANGTNAVYAYEDGALFSFREAKKLQLKCLYDLPIGYWRAAKRLLEIESERWPEWAATLIGLEDSAGKLARKDEELRLADKIFVASRFTANTLKDYPGKLSPIEVIPYAFPPVVRSRNYAINSASKPLKLLFVGGLSQRKGIADLFAVVEKLKNYVELTVVGKKLGDQCPALDAALAKHR